MDMGRFLMEHLRTEPRSRPKTSHGWICDLYEDEIVRIQNYHRWFRSAEGSENTLGSPLGVDRTATGADSVDAMETWWT